MQLVQPQLVELQARMKQQPERMMETQKEMAVSHELAHFAAVQTLH